jgi:3-dehydroquinate synthase
MSHEDRVVRVDLAAAPHNVHVKAGLMEEIGRRLVAISPSQRAVLMTDSQVAGQWGNALRSSCASGELELIAECVIPAGEESKNLESVQKAYDIFLKARIERTTPILALGGGVIGDMAGFVAATILRGVPFVQIPTTLLAMVDASVGGKTGVNHSAGKNLIGAFHQPMAVFADPNVLRTLPRPAFIGGLAECIKHDLIRDAAGFAALETSIGQVLDMNIPALTRLIAHNVRIKARVVESDPFEKGERAHLNFGHTFGHAIEKVSNYSVSHGEAVALGMTAAVYVSTKLGMIDQATRQRIIALIELAGLPTHGITLPTDALVDAMMFDKKVKAGKIRFVLLEQLGKATIRDDVPADVVRAAIGSLQG